MAWLLGDSNESTIPKPKTRMAYGSFGYMSVESKRTTAAIAQIKLSPHQGLVQVKGVSILEPALKQSDRPAPTCIPLTTGIGVTRFAHLISPVILKKPTTPATTRPAAAFSSSVNCPAIATAAIAFMGCTGKGSPNVIPVKILAAPVNNSVDGSEIEFDRTSAVISGRSVPKSPSDPDSSASGCDLMVSILCLLTRRSREVRFETSAMAAIRRKIFGKSRKLIGRK